MTRLFRRIDERLALNKNAAAHFPDLEMRLHNLLRFIGDGPVSPSPSLTAAAWQAIMGAESVNDTEATIAKAEQWPLAQVKREDGNIQISLTYDGWEQLRAQKRKEQHTNQAFIICTSQSPELTSFVDSCLIPSLTNAAYAPSVFMRSEETLDLRLIARLREGALMITDISGEDDIAPWPTVIAHALRKPVLHIRDSKSDGHHCAPDTCLCGAPTVAWDMDQPLQSKERLKAALQTVADASPQI